MIIKADYDAESFTVHVTYPVALLLREHAVWLKLMEKFPETYKNLVKTDYVTSLKDAWKYVNCEAMGKLIDKKFEYNDSPFVVQVNLLYNDDNSECSCLYVELFIYIYILDPLINLSINV